jgi:iron complex transport system substrate-binding protein
VPDATRGTTTAEANGRTAAGEATKGRPVPTRIVSLVPSVTEMLFAIGAGNLVVGVSSFDTFPPEVDALPKVGALVDPDNERILSLRPDLVVVYGSQDQELARFETAGIRTYVYRHAGIEGTLDTIVALGELTGHAGQAAELVATLRAQLAAVAAKVQGRPRPRTVLVFGRAPGTLQGLFASGGVGFLHEMLSIAGGENALADMLREAVQPSHEQLITRAPEVVLEISALPLDAAGLARARDAWSVLPSLPAVRAKRIVFLSGSELVVPGPRLARGTEAFARALHPEAFN